MVVNSVFAYSTARLQRLEVGCGCLLARLCNKSNHRMCKNQKYVSPVVQSSKLSGIVVQFTECRCFILAITSYAMGSSMCVHTNPTHTHHICYRKLYHNNHVCLTVRETFLGIHICMPYSRVAVNRNAFNWLSQLLFRIKVSYSPLSNEMLMD